RRRLGDLDREQGDSQEPQHDGLPAMEPIPGPAPTPAPIADALRPEPIKRPPLPFPLRWGSRDKHALQLLPFPAPEPHAAAPGVVENPPTTPYTPPVPAPRRPVFLGKVEQEGGTPRRVPVPACLRRPTIRSRH
ncbi:MAG: hypothetical protein K6A65_00145, partial [Succinivibrionaceae bacterium]|nr:hypothetical protein [Succinivibrionaceae bacterium]